MKFESLSPLLLVAWAASSCGEEPRAPGAELAPAAVRMTRQEVRSTHKVLILGSSVSGGINSPEAAAVRAFTEPDWPIDIVTPAQWQAMTPEQFMSYHAIIIGDAGCMAGTAAFQAAIDNRETWGPVIDGDVVILGTNPSSGSTPQLMRNGIEQLIRNSAQYHTGLYVSLGCSYQNAAPGTVVPLLDELGEFRVEGSASNCAATTGHRFEMHPLYVTKATDDAYLGRGGCAARSVFTTYPFKNFAVAAIGLNAPSSQEYTEYLQNEPEQTPYFGTPYILVRGAIALGAGCGGLSDYVPSGEECDLGDNGNGMPVVEGLPAETSCSFSCRLNWCGDGVVDLHFGEECDRGFYNGRTPDGNGAITNNMCTKSCQLVDFPQPPNNPPVPRCMNVTVSAPANACGAPANINNGSSDSEDGTNINCVQSPASPYNVGTTTVTLTCTDSGGLSASCTGTVTVRDITPPTVTVGTPNRSVECTTTSSYSDLADITTNELCSNPVTMLARQGTVNMRVPGNYVLTYSARDAAQNVGSANRTVTVQDTRAPSITLNSPTTMPVECASPFVEPGYSAADSCYGNLTSSVVVDGTVNTVVVGSYPLTYRLTDPSGNVASPKVRNLNVRDTTPPTVTVLGDLNQTVECNDSAYQDPGATASDSCVGTLPTTASPPPNAGVVGTQTIQYRATDLAGNVGTSTNSRTLTVIDTLPPVVTLSGNATMGLECAAAWSDPGATGHDQCAGNLAVTVSNTVDNRQLGAQTINYTATDPQGRSDMKTRTVTVSDTVAPTVTPNGELSQTVECNDPNYREPGATVSEACDPMPPAAVVVNALPLGTPGSYTVNYEAMDRAGNVGRSATGRSVTVVDTLNPTVTLNGSAFLNLECGTSWNDPGAMASDQCAGPLAVTTTGSVDNRNLITQTLTYRATDGQGHSDTKTRSVTVRDTQVPTVTLNGPLSQRVECNDPTYRDPGATASDACDVPPPAAVAVNPPPVGNPGSYTVNYEATDRSGNVGRSARGRSVTVEDTLPPTLTVQGPNPQQLECGTSWDDPGATANDQCAGPLTPNRSGGVNHGVLADYTITYSVTDGRTPTLTQIRTVHVRDTLPPQITVNGPIDQQFECGNAYVDPGASATDVCAGQVAVTATRNGDSTRPGDFTITYSARDPSGNEVTSPVVRTVHVNDNAPPTLALVGSGSQTVECATTWNDPGATANDACFGDLTAFITRDGNVDNMRPALYPLTYRVTDPAGLSATSVQRDVRVQDTRRPVVTVNGPLNIPVECGDNTYRDPGATANDSCGGTLPAVPSTEANPEAPGAYVIGYMATDPSGNVGRSETSRTVTVSDTLNPVLTLNGNAAMTLECATPWNDPGATANDQCAGNLTGLIQRTGSVNNMQPAPYRLTYSVTDPSGRSDSKERAVTVRDTLVPEITVQGPLTDSFECGQTYADPGATANDACAGNVPVTSTREGNPSQPGEVIIRYSAQDPSGNRVTSPVERRVTVNDNAPPTLVLLGSGTQSVECGTSWNDPGATANDACFGDLTASITRDGSVRPGTTGSYPLTYRVTDPAGLSAEPVQRTVNVNDTLAPIITVLGPLTQSVQCNRLPYEDPGATAADQCAGNLTGAIVRTGSVNTGAAGEYTLSYRVVDPTGNQTTAAEFRTVTVVDDQAPSILLTGPANGTHECGSSWIDPGATANDVCAGGLTAQIQRWGAVNGGTPGLYTLGYTVEDPSGLTASTQRQVTVNDTLAPALALIGPATQNVECGPGYQDPGATATDACAGNLDAQIQVTGAANPLVVGNYTVSYAVSDNVGNAAGPLNRAVRVRDTVAPNIIVNGPLDQQFECGDTYVDPGAQASDVCADRVTVTSTRSGNSDQPGTFTITYSARDPSGNEVTSPFTRTVRVSDNTHPTLALMGDAAQMLECGTAWADPGARASDACYGDLTASITRIGTVNSSAPGSYPIIYNVTDGSGNSAPSVNRTVHVRDTTLPVVTVLGPLNQIYECGDGTYEDPGATASDSCAGTLPTVPTTLANLDVPGTYVISYRATDPSGNVGASSSSRTVTVRDTLNPELSLLGSAEMSLECATPWNDPGATANDQCAGNLTGQIRRTGSVNNMRPAAYSLRYFVTDPSGRNDDTERMVTVRDTQVPSITVQGPLSDSSECGTLYVDPGATANDACAGAVPVTTSWVGNPNQPGTFTITYAATDPSGNTVTSPVIRTVRVSDNVQPTLELNGLATDVVECGAEYADPGAVAHDVCFGDVSSNIQRTGTLNPGTPGIYPLTYGVTDPAGRSATPVQRTVVVLDTLRPAVTVNGPLDITVECGDDSYTDLGATATDACAGPLPAQPTSSANPNVPGAYTILYLATDPSGHSDAKERTVTVSDTLAPDITVRGPLNDSFECGSSYVDPGATAHDACAGDVPVISTLVGNPNQPGTFTISYSAADASGNSSTSPLQRAVTVSDTAPPRLALLGPGIEVLECGAEYNDPGATAQDACFGDVSNSIQRTGTLNTRVPGIYPLTYSVTDPGGRSATPAYRAVIVQDTVSPTLALRGPRNQQIECGSGPYQDPGATAHDSCAGELTSSITRSGLINTSVPGEYTLDYNVTDRGGNNAPAVSRRVRVVDTEAPSIVCPEPIVAEAAEGNLATVLPGLTRATDTCSQVQVSGPTQTRFPMGTTSVTYTAMDAAGNTSSCTTTVTVVAFSLPDTWIISGPPDETEDTDATFKFSASKPNVTYECSLDGSEFSECPSTTTLAELAEGEHTLQVRARDSMGNVDSTPASATWMVAPPSSAPLDRALLGSGNGCSSTGSAPTSLAVVGLGVLAALLARKRTRPGLLALGVLLLGPTASAQLEGVPTFELELLKLNPSGMGSLLLGTGELLPDGGHRFSVTTHYENDPLVLFQNGEKMGVVVQHRATAHLAAAYGLWGWVELGAQVPMLLLQRGDDLAAHGIGKLERGPTPGTPLLTLRVKLLAEREADPVDLSLGVHAGPAVGSGAALARELRATPSLMAGRRFSLLRAAIDAGILLRPRTVLSPDQNIQDELGHALRLGGTLSTLGEGPRGELTVIARVPLKREGSSIETLAGARWSVSDAFEAYGLAGLAFGNAPGTPDFRVLLGVAYGRARSQRVESIQQAPVPNPPELPDSSAHDGEAVPEKDSDSDDILDENDACPTEAGIPEMHGCPARDSDHDTVQDHLDNCPEVAGPVDNQGCPAEEKQLVAIQKDRIKIKDAVHFDFDMATIQPRSFPLLDQVARILMEHPEILSVTIEGHTDERGSAEYNRDLSQQRAEAVCDYLAQKGVVRERMQAQGFGEDRPVQPNATDEGRAANRRVEFITRYTQAEP